MMISEDINVLIGECRAAASDAALLREQAPESPLREHARDYCAAAVRAYCAAAGENVKAVWDNVGPDSDLPAAVRDALIEWGVSV